MFFPIQAPRKSLLHVASRVARSSDDDHPPTRPIRVLPNGSASLLVTWAPSGVSFELFGPRSTALDVWAPEAVEKLELTLRPGAIPRIFGLPAKTLRNSSVSLDEICGNDTKRELRRLQGAEPNHWGDRIRRVERWLEAKLGNEMAPTHQGLGRALHIAHASGGCAAVGELVRCAQTSERQLERLFDLHVGLAPKRYLRLIRFRGAVRKLEAGIPAAEVASCSGFADQAHLSREVRAFSGVPPSRLHC